MSYSELWHTMFFFEACFDPYTVLTREKGRWAIDLSTGLNISLVVLGRGWKGRHNSNRGGEIG